MKRSRVIAMGIAGAVLGALACNQIAGIRPGVSCSALDDCKAVESVCRPAVACENGACVFKGAPEGAQLSPQDAQCGTGMTCCASGCVDISTDAANCGSCGHRCECGACEFAVCQPVVLAKVPKEEGDPYGVAVDATTIYWTNYIRPTSSSPAGGSVMKMPLEGGLPQVTTVAHDQSSPTGIAVDSANIYWTNFDGGTVMKVAIGGGTPSVVAQGQGHPLRIVVDTTSIYWTNNTSGSVMKAPTAGGAMTTLASPSGSLAWGIAVDSTSVYWTSFSATASAVMKVPLGGGSVASLTETAEPLEDIVADATSLYWVSAAAGTVSKMPIGGGLATVLSHGSIGGPYGIAVDATNIYWTDSISGTLMKTSLDGQSTTTLASKQETPRSVAVDGKCVYWVAVGHVMKVAK